MVQGTVVVLITLFVYSLAWIGIITYAYYCLPLEAGDWIQLFILLVALGVFMLEGLGQILKVLRQSKLKIMGSHVEVANEGTKGEFKDVYFVIKNVGGEEATHCEIEVAVENHTSYRLRGVPFDLIPDKERVIHFQQIVKSNGKTSRLSEKSPTLSIGQVYECEVKFYGKNFRKKIHHLKLDLSSWENIGIILDC